MSSTYSPILRSELIGAGDQAGTWGSTTNSNFQYIFESAIAGYVAVTVSPTSNNQILTYVNGPSASPALDQSVYAILKLNAGTLGANFNIFAPPVSKTYVIWNNTAYTATFYNSTVIGNTTAAGSGAVIPAGAKVWIWSDGTSFYGNDTSIGNYNVAGNLTVTGNETIGGTLGVTGNSTFGGTLSVTGALAALGSMNVIGNASFGGTLGASGIVTSGNGFNGPGTYLTGTASALNIGGNAATATNATNASYANGLNSYNGSNKIFIGWNGSGTFKVDATDYGSTWPISISGNANTVSNGVYNNNGTYNININGSAGSTAYLDPNHSYYFLTSPGQPGGQGWGMVNTDGGIGGWSIGNDYIQVYLNGSAYGIHVFLSDENVKKNIEPSTYKALDTVKAIEFKEFDYDEKKSIKKGHVKCGVTAQQIQSIDSDLVEKAGDYLSPKIDEMLYVAMKAIQELQAEVEDLKAKLAKG